MTLMNIILSDMLSNYTTKTAVPVFLRLRSVFFLKNRVSALDQVPFKSI